MMASLGNFKTHGGNSDDRGNSETHNFGTLNFWECAKTRVFYLLTLYRVLPLMSIEPETGVPPLLRI